MKLNYRLLTVLLFALAVSICAGSFFEVFMTGEGKQQIENILGSLLNAESDGLSVPGPSDNHANTALLYASPRSFLRFFCCYDS